MSKKQKKNPLETLSKADLDKIAKLKASTEGHYKVDNEWLLLTEFALKFGWDAYRDAKEDRILLSEMLTLLEASRRLDNYEFYKAAQASFIGAGSARSKKPSNTFKQLTRKILKGMKADV